MTSPSENDQPSTELALRDEVAELRAELEQVRRTPAPRRVIKNEIDRWVEVIADYSRFANVVSGTDFVPKALKGKPEQVTAIMMFGREIGVPPMTGLMNMYSVHNRIGMYAEQLRAMILNAGHECTIIESTSDRCVIHAKRAGTERTLEVIYTMDEAKRAGYYAQNERYRTNPVDMLVARCTGRTAKFHFPDVIRGMQVAEELDDGADEAPTSGAVEQVKAPTVQRKTKPKPAAAIEQAKPAAPPVAPDQPALPPLPGEAEPPTAITDPPQRRTEAEVLSGAGPAGTSGEGPASAPEDIQSEPTGPTPDVFPDDPDAIPPIQETELPDREMQVRHCPDYDNSHDKHLWQLGGEDVNYLCSGMVNQDVKGLAETRKRLESGALPDKPKPMSPAQTRLLQSRFRSLGYTDDPEDREVRLTIAAVLAGRDEVTTFRAGTPESMSSVEASRVIDGLADCRDRDDVLELMVKLAQDTDAEDTGR